MENEALLALLPSLVALVETQSVTAAARRVGVSQPRMSARLAQLRALLGDPILVPANGRRGFVATDQAAAWTRLASTSLRELALGFSRPHFDPGSTQHSFRIMANENATLMVCAPLVRAFRRIGAGLRLVLFNFEKSLVAGLADGDYDIVLGRPHQFRDMSTLITRNVVQDRFATISSIEGEGAPDLDAFCARGHVLISTNPSRPRGKVDEALARIGRTRTIVASVESHLQAIELVSGTDLIATVPRMLALGRSGQVLASDPPIPFDPFTIAAAWHPRKTSDPAHRWLRETLVSVASTAETCAR